MNNNSMDDMMKAMLDANQQREVESKQRQQEQQVREEVLQRFQQLITEQRDNLVSILGSVVDEFNQRSLSGQISVSLNGNHIRYGLPLQQEDVILEFFTVEPPLNLSSENFGFVSLAGYLKGHKNTGRNFLWCRQSTDETQGNWVACLVTTTANLRLRPGRKPYGIVYGFENERDLRNIEKSISRMDVYKVSFENDVRKEFLHVLSDAMKTVS